MALPLVPFHEPLFIITLLFVTFQERLASFSYPVSAELDTVQAGGWGYDDTPFTPCRTVFVLEREVLRNGVARLLDMFKVPTDS